MSKTNIFKPLTSNAGEIYMFSQYVEDLTKENSQKSVYKVIPSKFAAININMDTLKEKMCGFEVEGFSDLPNNRICATMQNSYENSCAFFRDILPTTHTEENEDDIIWHNFMASRLLWQNMLMYGMITMEENEEGVKICPEIKYVGDINIHSNKSMDGICYNELYCYIPTEAKSRQYVMTSLNEDDITYDNPIFFEYDKNHLLGWNTNNYPANLESAGIPNVPLFGLDGEGQVREGGYTIGDDNWYYPRCLSWKEEEMNDEYTYIENDEEFFNVNAIVVFYNIYKKNDEGIEEVYYNLPYGIYFTGKVETTLNNIVEGESNNEEEDDWFINNTIKKFVNNNDIYGQGTSYGLRIMSKFVSTPNSLFYIDSVFEIDDFYPEYVKLMSRMSETLDVMDDIIESNRVFHQDIKDHLAYFKNYRTNVPYIRIINGVPYWFVNGHNTNQPAVVTEESIQSQITNLTSRLDELTFRLRNLENNE